MATVQEELGPVDLLVNNAALGTVSGPIAEADSDEWWRCLDVNLRGPFLFSKAVLPSMIERQSGRIVSLSSGAGLGAPRNFSAYVISKAAVLKLTEILAGEVADSGIRTFSVDPGTVRTAVLQDLLDSEQGQKWLPWVNELLESKTGCSSRTGGKPHCATHLRAGRLPVREDGPCFR